MQSGKLNSASCMWLSATFQSPTIQAQQPANAKLLRLWTPLFVWRWSSRVAVGLRVVHLQGYLFSEKSFRPDTVYKRTHSKFLPQRQWCRLKGSIWLWVTQQPKQVIIPVSCQFYKPPANGKGPSSESHAVYKFRSYFSDQYFICKMCDQLKLTGISTCGKKKSSA